VAISPDANLILAGYANGYIRLWNANGTIQRELGDEATRHTGSISSIQFFRDGKWALSSSWDGTAKIWDPDTGMPLAVLQREDTTAVSAAAFSPDGKTVICGYADGAAWAWNSDGKGGRIKLEGHSGGVTSISFSPDGLKVVTGAEDHSARIWNLRLDDSSKVSSPTILSGHTLAVRAVAFSTDGKKIVTASDDGTARVWWSESQEPRILGKHADKVNSVAFSPDGKKVVSTSDDKTARVWNIDGSYQDLVYKSDSYVRSAAFDAAGTRVVAGSEDGTVYLWQLGAKGQYLSAESDVLSVAFAPDGLAVITGTQNNLAQVWSIDYSRNKRPLLELKGHDDWVWRAAFNREGSRIVTASQDTTAMIWDVNRQPWAIKSDPQRLPHEKRVLDAAFSPDGSRVATASADRRARIWTLKHTAPGAKEVQATDQESQHSDKEFQHLDEVWSVEFSFDGKWLLTGSADKTAKIWGIDDGKPFLVFSHPSGVHTAAFQPGSLDVVTGGNDGLVRLWRTDLHSLMKYLGTATNACLTPRERVRFLAESEEDARRISEACETSHGRTPLKALGKTKQ
jgi:WD40 repeat protein